MIEIDEIDLLNAIAYMRGDLSSVSDEEFKILNKHFDTIKDSYESGSNFRASCVNAFNYYHDKPALCILLIRKLTDANIIITYEKVPEFKDLVNEVGPILRKVRTIF